MDAAGNIARAATRALLMLLMLPRLSELTGEAMAALPRSIQPLLEQYNVLVAQILEQIGVCSAG